MQKHATAAPGMPPVGFREALSQSPSVPQSLSASVPLSLCPSVPSRTRSGFTLIELMVVLFIIGLLVGLVLSVIWAIRGYQQKVEARTTCQNMLIGIASLKRNYDFDQVTPLGVYGNGSVKAGEATFTDTNRDFDDEGVGGGATVYILNGSARGSREVLDASDHVLTLAGGNYASSARMLVYFIVKADSTGCPEINIARELDPANDAWPATFAPHVNTRKIQYYPCRKRRIGAEDMEFHDPWGKPYRYELRPRDKFIEERVLSAGPDTKYDTGDDIFEVAAEIPFVEE